MVRLSEHTELRSALALKPAPTAVYAGGIHKG